MLSSRTLTIASSVVSLTTFSAVVVLLPLIHTGIQRRNTELLGLVEECQVETKGIWRQMTRFEASALRDNFDEFSANRIREKRQYAAAPAYRAQGRSGSTCCSCQQGKVGPPGPQGQPGKDGVDGSPGIPGRNGRDGQYIIPVSTRDSACQKCPSAPVGPPGLPGLKGNRGAPGQAGNPGKDGFPGRQGPRGPIGPPGATGSPGLAGPRGDPGKILNGGMPGPAGKAGQPGPRGRRGNDGSVGRPGNPGIEGPRGEPGRRGPDGIPGPAGPLGLNGSPGQPGSCAHCENQAPSASEEYFKPAGSTAEPEFVQAEQQTRRQEQVSPSPVVNEYNQQPLPNLPPESKNTDDYDKPDLPPLKVYGKKTFKGGPLFKRRPGYYQRRH